MATFTKKPTGWLCQVRRKGHKPTSKMFKTKLLAERWANEIEGSMLSGVYAEPVKSEPFSVYIERYIKEVTPTKKGSKRETFRLKRLLKFPIVTRSITELSKQDVIALRDELLETIAPISVSRDLATLSQIVKTAISEWDVDLVNPFLLVKTPKIQKKPKRRLLAGEEELILNNCDGEARSFFIVALETAMRRSELFNLRSTDINQGIATLRDTKNGYSRSVPLSNRALAELDKVRKPDGSFWSYTDSYYSTAFTQVCRKVGLSGLSLHSLRHEATTRFIEMGLSPAEVCSITGHRSLTMLDNYTHIDAVRLREKLVKMG